ERNPLYNNTLQKFTRHRHGKNKANQSQNKPNSSLSAPYQTQNKPNSNPISCLPQAKADPPSFPLDQSLLRLHNIFVPESEKINQQRKFKIKIITRNAIIRIAVAAAILTLAAFWAYNIMIKSPGKSYSGPLLPLTEEQIALRAKLMADVGNLALKIGERNIYQPKNLAAAADFIESSLAKAGCSVTRQTYTVDDVSCSNLEVKIAGSIHPEQIVIVGSHYDTVYGCPGANDNATAVAANLALARHFALKKPDLTLRFVFFVNEEPPFFQTPDMGSTVYAKKCKDNNENIIAMLSLETLGYYSDQPNSQKYPPPLTLFYPSTADFIAFVSNPSSRRLLHRVVSTFRQNCKFPSESGAIPSFLTGIAWSDHYSFWQQGYPALMVTDTAPFRYPYYHEPGDTVDKIDFDNLTRVVSGMKFVISDLTKSD
ncbi:MAG: M28 family peptidase, partial [Sedimentisphaerales bacterium]|nr:M28 family peptidase [Sedimentisphaerales bacterium]